MIRVVILLLLLLFYAFCWKQRIIIDFKFMDEGCHVNISYYVFFVLLNSILVLIIKKYNNSSDIYSDVFLSVSIHSLFYINTYFCLFHDDGLCCYNHGCNINDISTIRYDLTFLKSIEENHVLMFEGVTLKEKIVSSGQMNMTFMKNKEDLIETGVTAFDHSMKIKDNDRKSDFITTSNIIGNIIENYDSDHFFNISTSKNEKRLPYDCVVLYKNHLGNMVIKGIYEFKCVGKNIRLIDIGFNQMYYSYVDYIVYSYFKNIFQNSINDFDIFKEGHPMDTFYYLFKNDTDFKNNVRDRFVKSCIELFKKSYVNLETDFGLDLKTGFPEGLEASTLSNKEIVNIILKEGENKDHTNTFKEHLKKIFDHYEFDGSKRYEENFVKNMLVITELKSDIFNRKINKFPKNKFKFIEVENNIFIENIKMPYEGCFRKDMPITIQEDRAIKRILEDHREGLRILNNNNNNNSIVEMMKVFKSILLKKK